MNFLDGQTQNFFGPLTGRRRSLFLRCIQGLHGRLYDANNRDQQPLSREELRDLFVLVIRESPPVQGLAEKFVAADPGDFDAADDYELASRVIHELISTGWIEIDEDRASMSRSFRFSRFGRTFADSLVEVEQPSLKTRQRNVRKTAHFLEAYLRELDPFDLIDALTHAEYIVRDFADDIAELHIRRQRLLSEAMTRVAIVDFLDYIETKFSPDLSIRLSADSVERHQKQIVATIGKIRRLTIARLEPAQERLRRVMQGQTLYELQTPLPRMLDRIERTVHNACRTKLPELRAALQAYVTRSSLMIRQASSLLGGEKLIQLRRFLDAFAQLDGGGREQTLIRIGDQMALAHIRRVDPADFILDRERRHAAIVLAIDDSPPTPEELLEAALLEAEANAFAVNLAMICAVLLPLLEEAGTLRLSNLNVTDSDSMLIAVFALVALASVQDDGAGIRIKTTGDIASNRFFEQDDVEFTRRGKYDTP